MVEEREKSQDGNPPSATTQWIAYELHDGLLQWIQAAKMQVEACSALLEQMQDRLAEPEAKRQANLVGLVDAANDRLQLATHELAMGVDEGRQLIGFLEHASAPKKMDLGEQLQVWVDALGRGADELPSVELQVDSQAWPALPQRDAWNLLRIAQQAVSNAMEHARAKQIKIDVAWAETRKQLEMTIVDDGVGFDPQQVSSESEGGKHFGLSSMQHRARLCQARLEIDAAPDRGCCIRLVKHL